MRRKYYFALAWIIPIVLIVGLVGNFHSLLQYYKESTFESLRKQARIIGRNIENTVAEFEEGLKYTVTTGSFERFLSDDVTDIKVVDAIRRFYSKNQDLIERIEFYNPSKSRSITRRKDNYFEISSIKNNSPIRPLIFEPHFLQDGKEFLYVVPLYDERGDIVASIRLTLNIPHFLEKQLANYYIGQSAWIWCVDSDGALRGVFSPDSEKSDFAISQATGIDAIRHDVVNQFEGTLEHSIFSRNKIEVLSAYYPIVMFQSKIGIVLSVSVNSIFGVVRARIIFMSLFFIGMILWVALILSFVIYRQHIAELKLAESEQRWQFALEGSGDGVWDWDLVTNQVFFSKRWKEMIGFQDDEIKNDLDEWKKRVHPEDLSRTMEDLKRHWDKKSQVYNSEYRFLAKDGTYKYILDRGITVKAGPDGTPLRMVGTHSDITERKRAEEKLRQLSYAVDQSASTVFITDVNGIVEYVNPKFTDITGYAQEEIVGTKARILRVEKMPFKQHQDMWKTISGGKEWRGEFKNKKKNGDDYWERVVISSIKNSMGQIINFLVAAEDITQQKIISEKLEEERKTLEIFYQATVHQEMDAIALKKEINELLRKGSLPARYPEVADIEKIVDIKLKNSDA